MKWYKLIIPRILKGIVVFLIPVIIILIILEKAFVTIKSIVEPLKGKLPQEHLFGIGIITLLSLVIILLLCYLAGAFADHRFFKSKLNKIDNILIYIIPGYSLMKSRVNDTIVGQDEAWKAVMIADGDDWRLGIEIEKKTDGFSVVFFPEPPDAKSGEVKLIHQSKIKSYEMSVGKLVGIIRKYGKGITNNVD